MKSVKAWMNNLVSRALHGLQGSSPWSSKQESWEPCSEGRCCHREGLLSGSLERILVMTCADK